MPRLTAKQARFVGEYLIDLNATQAAIRAGYSPKQSGFIGYQLLQKTPIQLAIQSAMRARSARTGITQDRILAEIAKIAFGNLRDIMTWGGEGVVMKESSALTDDQAAIVVEVFDTRSESGGALKVKIADKLGALEKLARHVGLYSDDGKKHVSVSVKAPDWRALIGPQPQSADNDESP